MDEGRRPSGAQDFAPRPLRWAAGALALAVTWGAQAAPVSLHGGYSKYEQQAISDAEAELGAKVDLAPEGKTIERYDFVRLDPIDSHDPLPVALDAIHATSRVAVVQRELLVREGDRWDGALVDESARNLRLLPQLSLVLCVAMTGSAPGLVRLVVITKDVWSLFVDFSIQSTSGGLELLDLEPKEANIAGLHHVARLRFILQPKSYSVGADYEIPRVAGALVDARIDANLIINRESQAQEGSYGVASVTRRLYSARDEWAWGASVNWTDQVLRRYSNAAVLTFNAFSPALPGAKPVPWLWYETTATAQASLTRSFGYEVKNDFTAGASYSRAAYGVPWDPLNAEAVAQFVRAEVPVGENRAGPYVQWHGYSTDFLRLIDLDSLGLQEDYRLGHDLWLRAYPVFEALGSTRGLLGGYAAASYGVAFGDGLLRASLESTVEGSGDGISDASIQAGLGAVTPRTLLGRLVFSATVLARPRNHLNAQSQIGGDSLLRGYPSHLFSGKDLVAANLEWRSRSLSVASIQMGAAAFVDMGDAFNGFDALRLKQSAGFGLRFVFPQFDRTALRLDFGFPFSARPLPADVPRFSFYLAFHQAVGLPVVGVGKGP